MRIFIIVLFMFLVVCAIAVSFSKNLLNSILIYMSFSLIMSLVWIVLESPDLAITEAAVGAGVTTLLFFGCFKKIGAIKKAEIDTVEEIEVDTVRGYENEYIREFMPKDRKKKGPESAEEKERKEKAIETMLRG